MSTEQCICGDAACESELCNCDATPCPVNHRAEEAEAERERLWLALCEEVEKCHQSVAERDAANATITRVRRMAQGWVDMYPTREGRAIAYAGQQILAALDASHRPT